MSERRRMMANKVVYLAPGIRALEYVENVLNNGTGSSAIRTSLYCNYNDNFEVTFKLNPENTSSHRLFGQSYYTVYNLYADDNLMDGIGNVCLGIDDYYYCNLDDTQAVNVYEKRGSVFYINGVSKITGLSTASTQTRYPINLCSVNYQGNSSALNNGAAGYYYGFKFYNGNSSTLKADFRPAIRESDGIAGFYDTVGKVFYRSNSNVDFTAGPNARK